MVKDFDVKYIKQILLLNGSMYNFCIQYSWAKLDYLYSKIVNIMDTFLCICSFSYKNTAERDCFFLWCGTGQIYGAGLVPTNHSLIKLGKLEITQLPLITDCGNSSRFVSMFINPLCSFMIIQKSGISPIHSIPVFFNIRGGLTTLPLQNNAFLFFGSRIFSKTGVLLPENLRTCFEPSV